ncbi:MAG: DNA polymerase III subunit gamma/tau, partial [Rickettsiales bacterium]
SSYVVLARKYRPQNFDELVGQDVLVKTLTNAIKNNRLHHAYILHGIRGIGKTTTARIIAKTLNCLNDETRNQGLACGVCKNCVAISNSHHQDVLELDAASKTGVNDVRQIIESIAYKPVEARYKIYIIDEFHMMSDSAFNAFLKTIEEPPADVKFIFATTEIREVPQTILSRCQKFDLRRLDENEIVLHLKNILAKEGFEAQEQALNLIAKISEGSVRDSLSLLDQALASNNHQQLLTSDIVEKMLGMNDRNLVLELFENLLNGDFSKAQQSFLKIYQSSSDISQLMLDLLELLHNVIILKTINNINTNSFSANQLNKLQDFAQNNDLSRLLRIWQLLSKAKAECNLMNPARMFFEILMIRICHLVALPDLKNILLELEQQNNGQAPEFEVVNNVNATNDFVGDVSSSSQNYNSQLVLKILQNFEGSKIINS